MSQEADISVYTNLLLRKDELVAVVFAVSWLPGSVNEYGCPCVTGPRSGTCGVMFCSPAIKPKSVESTPPS